MQRWPQVTHKTAMQESLSTSYERLLKNQINCTFWHRFVLLGSPSEAFGPESSQTLRDILNFWWPDSNVKEPLLRKCEDERRDEERRKKGEEKKEMDTLGSCLTWLRNTKDDLDSFLHPPSSLHPIPTTSIHRFNDLPMRMSILSVCLHRHRLSHSYPEWFIGLNATAGLCKKLTVWLTDWLMLHFYSPVRALSQHSH